MKTSYSTSPHPVHRRPVRILIVMSDTGGGHRSAAQALKGAFQSLYGSSVEIYIVDFFALQRPTPVDRLTRLYGPLIRHSPWLWGALYKATDSPQVYRGLVRTLEPLQIPKVRRLLEALAPDAVVSVHPLCTRVVAHAIQRLRRPIPLIAMPTDLVSVHASHIDPAVDLFIAPTQGSMKNLIARGVPSDKIISLGLPVDERFGPRLAGRSPSELRNDLGLDPQRFTALLMGGGEGAGPLSRIVQAVDESGLPIQMLVVCGRNAVCRSNLEKARRTIACRIFGFVHNVPDLMAASDVVITKAGPQTIAEALAAGRPLLLTHALPGQEDDNVQYVEAGGAGYFTPTPEEVVARLKALIEQPSKLAWLQEQARGLGRPQAAREAAQAVMSMAPVPAPQPSIKRPRQRWEWGPA
ncbi:MAG: glycosyltransferase [Chloroflexota bacterium]